MYAWVWSNVDITSNEGVLDEHFRSMAFHFECLAFSKGGGDFTVDFLEYPHRLARFSIPGLPLFKRFHDYQPVESNHELS